VSLHHRLPCWKLLRQVEALERQAGHRAWRIGQIESLPEDDEN
jgi:hypothetical protein